MKTSEKLGLNILESEDFADIEKINENFEKLESEAGVLENILNDVSNAVVLKKHFNSKKNVSTLPYSVDWYTRVVVYNGEIHLLGGYSNNTAHYKWDGSSWVSASTLPYPFYGGGAIVYNDEIHIFGSGKTLYETDHCKWNGTSWEYVSSLGMSGYLASAVIYNGEIHVLNDTSHMRYNGTEWVPDKSLNFVLKGGEAVIYNGEIHALGGDELPFIHRKWNGTSWVDVSTLPYFYNCSSIFVCDNEIHMLGSDDFSNHERTISHYKFNGTEWIKSENLPYGFNGKAIVYNGEINLLGGSNSTETKHTILYKESTPDYTLQLVNSLIDKVDTLTKKVNSLSTS